MALRSKIGLLYSVNDSTNANQSMLYKVNKIYLFLASMGCVLFSHAQIGPQNNANVDLGTPSLTTSAHTINTGDVESITVVKGAVYLFDKSSTSLIRLRR